MNACLKTGADVLIESHQAVLHGDLYVCGEMFILRYTLGSTNEPNYQYEQKRIDGAHASFFNNACDAADSQMPWAAPENLHLEGACVWMIHRDYVRLSEGLSALLDVQAAYRNHAIDKDDQFFP